MRDEYIKEFDSSCDTTSVVKTKSGSDSFGSVSIQLKLVIMVSYGFLYSFAVVVITKRTVDKDRA